MSEVERALASVRVIDDILVHENADSLEIAVIGGWKVVVKKGEYKPKDLVVYCEVDSWVPEAVAPFLSPENKDAPVYEGVRGNRLRTKKLRGVISQGLVLPLSILPQGVEWQEGEDVTETLGIIKWERTDAFFKNGIPRSTFPTHLVPKTDQERLENLTRIFERWKEQDLQWEVTEKMEGSSLTVIKHNEDFHVCSRNQSLKDEGENSFWKVVKKYGLQEKLEAIGKNIAIQAELVGPGIQGNIYKLNEVDCLVFDMYDVDSQKYLSSEERLSLCDELGLKHSPVVYESIKLYGDSVQQTLDLAHGKTLFGNSREQLREGLVWKCVSDPSISFKTVSSIYLSKEK